MPSASITLGHTAFSNDFWLFTPFVVSTRCLSCMPVGHENLKIFPNSDFCLCPCLPSQKIGARLIFVFAKSSVLLTSSNAVKLPSTCPEFSCSCCCCSFPVLQSWPYSLHWLKVRLGLSWYSVDTVILVSFATDFFVWWIAPCRLQGCKSRPYLFPGQIA